MQTKEQLLNLATENLLKIYKKYEEQGLLAVYLWGSIVRDDFDPRTSDIDCLVIVDESFPLELNQTIRDELTQNYPSIEWGFQAIYKCELDGGPLKSRAAKAMAPQSILPSFRDWVWVAGQHFKREDFKLPDASVAERMQLDIAAINRRIGGINDPDQYRKKRNRKGLVKAGLQLIYDRQLSRLDYFPLNYNRLLECADTTEKPILEMLLDIKTHDRYSESEFNQFVTTISDFNQKISSELSASKQE